MSGINGFEVVRRARFMQPGLKVLLITGHATRDVVRDTLGTGVDGVLAKPFTPDELRVVGRTTAS